MALATDILDDYALFDAVESVTVTPTVSAPAHAAVSSVQAVRRVFSARTAGSLNAVGEVVWHLFADTLSDLTAIEAGDKITDSAAVVWRVTGASKETLGARWRCAAVKERA